MPSPYDLLSQQMDTPTDPDDQLRLQMGQDQGANLTGGPQPSPDGMPQIPPGPSPNVPGPLAALAPPPGKPKIKLISKPAPKLKVKLKAKKPKPKIKLKSALQGFLDTIGR